MNANTNAVSDSRFESQAIADSPTRPTRPFFWSVRRELWENRSIYIAPLAAAGLVVLATFFGAFRFAAFRGKGLLWAPDAMQQMKIVEQQCAFTALLIMGVTFVVAIFYCLDAIYGERRDRSIFFWKSLPVSDTTTVLAKATIPLLIIPLLTFAITVVTQCLVLGIDAVTLAAHGQSLSVMRQIPLLQMEGGLLYHLIAVHSLWYAPIFAWLLLVSAWAPRVPLLWAIMPPLAVAIIEKIGFNTAHFINFLKSRVGGPPSGMSFAADMSGHSAFLNPGHFLTGPGLWGGLIISALFLAAAIQLRRYRAPN
ncbi:MAG TPA: ABC transporter permease [Acidobacteriaceae bacterium]|nr:ABC transporter permease [Acidobacteriaceae bacterium]